MKAARISTLCAVAAALLHGTAWNPEAKAAGWKAATARVAITPKEPLWMSGYAARTKPSQGVEHDLWAKALVLQDPTGKRAVIITLDICGIDRVLSTLIRDAIQSRHGLNRDQIVIACSHTHCGPVVGKNLLTMYEFDAAEHARIADYTRFLQAAVVEMASRALEDSLADVRLAWGTGQCDFAVNRRNNPEKSVPELRAKGALVGPVDHDVPVLRVQSYEGKPLAVVFSYACHCTVLDYYKFCGDYAGFTQIELEKRHPGAQAMFVAGCGGDQNPIPRRLLELAQRYGRQLADSVDRVLGGTMRPIEGPLRTAYGEFNLAFAELPTRAQIERDAASKAVYVARRAKHLLKVLAEKGSLPPDYPYPIAVWGLDDLRWVFLGGEVTVDYALRIKREAGKSPTWVAAYCNDVMAYIPSLRVLKEGGYEGADSMIYYGNPTTWSPRVEEDIIAQLAKLSALIQPATSRP